MKLNLTLGDVIRTHLKTQGRTLSSIEDGVVQNYDFAVDLVFGHPGYTGDKLPLKVSKWLVENIGLSTGYWRSVNKVLQRYDRYVQYKTVELDALTRFVYGRSPDTPKIEIDTAISSNTVLGTVLLYLDHLNGVELRLQNCTMNFENFSGHRAMFWWRILRKWSEQENPLDETILDSTDLIAVKDIASDGLYEINDMFHFISNDKDHWISPVRAVARSGNKWRIEWNPDFVSIMKQPVISVSPEEFNEIRWKDYV